MSNRAVRKAKALQHLDGVPPKEYNCGGFALSKRKWVHPYYGASGSCDREDRYLDLLEQGFSPEEAADCIVDSDVEILLKKYKFLKQVDINSLDPEEKVIAYRLFFEPCYNTKVKQYIGVEDCDFHFRVRINGNWYEKCGGQKVNRVENYSDAPWECGLRYTSKIAYFIDTRDCEQN